jgi:DNA-binding HxlR family transcriptional regulator
MALDSPNLIKASSVNRVLEVIGDRWVLLILQQCFLGVTGYEDFQHRLGIPRSTLSTRLRMLVEHNILSRAPSSNPKQRVDYRLTKKGVDLFDTALMALAWQQHWLPRFKHPAVKHLSCGHPMTPKLVCHDCRQVVDARDVTYRDGPGASWITRSPQRRRRSATGSSPTRTLAVSKRILDLFGDRWTPQVVALGFFGIRRFDEMQKALKLASNILTDRLKRAVDMGVFEQRRYQTRPARYEYRLTDQGRALYPMLVCMMQWGDRWHSGPEGPPLVLLHKPCGHPLRGVVICDQCGDELTPRSTQPIA